MRKVIFIILLIVSCFVNRLSFPKELNIDKVEHNYTVKETTDVSDEEDDDEINYDAYEDSEDEKIIKMVEMEEERQRLRKKKMKEETIDKKIEQYKESLKDKTVTMYINIGAGTTGGYIQASAYYLNIVGFKVEYSYLPYVNLINQLKTVVNDNRVSKLSIENKSSFGVDFSLRPFASLTRKLAGFRIDIGMRYFNGEIEIVAGEPLNILGEVRTALDKPGVNADKAVEVISNFFSLHGAPSDIWSGDAVLKIPVSLSQGFRPYVGIGWDFNLFKGFDLSFSVGCIITQWKVQEASLFYKDKPMSYYKETMAKYIKEKHIDGLISQEILKYFEKAIDDVSTQNTNNIKRTIDNLAIKDFKISQIWPVVQIGFGWQFDV